MNLNQIPAPVYVVIAIVAYAFFWCGLILMIGRISGWILLAQKYRTAGPFDGTHWHFQHAQFRWSCNYSGCLTVGANSTSLYLRQLFLFRPGHAPLMIPWSETKIEMKQSFWLGRYMEIEFPNVPGTRIRFREKLAQKIAAAISGQ